MESFEPCAQAEDISQLLLVETKRNQTSFSINPTGNALIDFNVEKTGWTPIGAVGFTTNNNLTTVRSIAQNDTNTWRIVAGNPTSSVQTITDARIFMLYIKNV